jgi:Holliday junction resolvasome RuvABC endonuclease subunit
MPFLDKRRTACITGIDPGSEFLGLCNLFFDVVTLDLLSVRAYTFVGSRLPYFSSITEYHHGHRRARLDAHQENLVSIFRIVNPLVVVCESPFFHNKRPSAFQPLVETLEMVKDAYYEYDPFSIIHQIDPASVKLAVGATSGAKKEAVHNAIMRMTDIPFEGCSPRTMSEHALDAFAVGYSRFRSYRRAY